VKGDDLFWVKDTLGPASRQRDQFVHELLPNIHSRHIDKAITQVTKPQVRKGA